MNLLRDDYLEIFSKSKVAIHTMKHEHFGIAVVELMASGMITVAHNSAGPKFDIIGGSPKEVGFLASSADEFSDCVYKSLTKFDDYKDLRKNAREWVHERFGPEEFD